MHYAARITYIQYIYTYVPYPPPHPPPPNKKNILWGTGRGTYPPASRCMKVSWSTILRSRPSSAAGRPLPPTVLSRRPSSTAGVLSSRPSSVTLSPNNQPSSVAGTSRQPGCQPILSELPISCFFRGSEMINRADTVGGTPRGRARENYWA